MEQFWFPLRNVNGCEHLPVNRIRFLKADGNYTQVYYYDEQGQEKHSLQSGNIGKYALIIQYGFVFLRRNIIVNRSMVVKHGKDHTVTLSCGETFIVPKKKWTEVKTLLSRQLVIPFTKKGDSFNQKDDSITE